MPIKVIWSRELGQCCVQIGAVIVFAYGKGELGVYALKITDSCLYFSFNLFLCCFGCD